MTKIIISEGQFNLLTKKLVSEAVGVPENILESGEKLYGIVSDFLKRINRKEDNYKGFVTTQLPVSDLTFETIMLVIRVEELDDYTGDVVMASAGVGNEFIFDNALLMQVNAQNRQIDLFVTFIVPKDWNPQDLYGAFVKDKTHMTSIMSHELKHKFDRQKKEVELLGGISDYSAYSSASNLRFGIPVIDKFMRYSYFIQTAENLVRPTEVASRMTQKNIKRKEFYDFITNDEVYIELKEIQNFSFKYLIQQLKQEMEYVDELIKHIGEDPTQMSASVKISEVLDLVYINLVNAKINKFDEYIYDMIDKAYHLFGQIGIGGGPVIKKNEEKEKVRNKYINHVIKYQNREIDFFKDECERFNYVATKIIKKISKVFALIPEGRSRNLSEENCIIEWDLYHEMMEKKYGRRKIDTEYKFKLKK